MLLVVQVAEGFEVPAWALSSPPHSTDELATRVDRATRPHVDGTAAPTIEPPLISVMVPTCNRPAFVKLGLQRRDLAQSLPSRSSRRRCDAQNSRPADERAGQHASRSASALRAAKMREKAAW